MQDHVNTKLRNWIGGTTLRVGCESDGSVQFSFIQFRNFQIYNYYNIDHFVP